MTNTHLFRVGDTVELRLDVLEKEGSDPGSLIDWYLYSGRSDCFVITKIDESYPEAPYLLDKFFCETNFSDEELKQVNRRECTLPIGTRVRINRKKLTGSDSYLLEWFRLFGDDEDIFTIVGYSSETYAPYVLDRYMGEVSFYEHELIPV